MIEKNFDLYDTNDCPGCKRLLMAYRYDCIRWNGVVWHTDCAMAEADRILAELHHVEEQEYYNLVRDEGHLP